MCAFWSLRAGAAAVCAWVQGAAAVWALVLVQGAAAVSVRLGLGAGMCWCRRRRVPLLCGLGSGCLVPLLYVLWSLGAGVAAGCRCCACWGCCRVA